MESITHSIKLQIQKQLLEKSSCWKSVSCWAHSMRDLRIKAHILEHCWILLLQS